MNWLELKKTFTKKIVNRNSFLTCTAGFRLSVADFKFNYICISRYFENDLPRY